MMVQAWKLSTQETETGRQPRVLRQTGVTQLSARLARVTYRNFCQTNQTRNPLSLKAPCACAYLNVNSKYPATFQYLRKDPVYECAVITTHALRVQQGTISVLD